MSIGTNLATVELPDGQRVTATMYHGPRCDRQAKRHAANYGTAFALRMDGRLQIFSRVILAVHVRTFKAHTWREVR